MIETRDDREDAIAAIEQAEGGAERRRASRIRRKVATQMVPWKLGVPATPFGVVIEDISETGVGIVHGEPLPVGMTYQLTVPRARMNPIVVHCETVRCERREDGLYKVGLKAGSKIEHIEQAKKSLMLTSKRTRLLFLAFGVVGIIVAAVVPL